MVPAKQPLKVEYKEVSNYLENITKRIQGPPRYWFTVMNKPHLGVKQLVHKKQIVKYNDKYLTETDKT